VSIVHKESIIKMSTVDQMDVEDDLGGTALPSPPPPPHSFEEPKSAQTESFLGSVLHFHQVAPTSLEQGLFRFLEDEQSDAVDDRVINLKSVLGELILPKDILKVCLVLHRCPPQGT